MTEPPDDDKEMEAEERQQVRSPPPRLLDPMESSSDEEAAESNDGEEEDAEMADEAEVENQGRNRLQDFRQTDPLLMNALKNLFYNGLKNLGGLKNVELPDDTGFEKTNIPPFMLNQETFDAKLRRIKLEIAAERFSECIIVSSSLQMTFDRAESRIGRQKLSWYKLKASNGEKYLKIGGYEPITIPSIVQSMTQFLAEAVQFLYAPEPFGKHVVLGIVETMTLLMVRIGDHEGYDWSSSVEVNDEGIETITREQSINPIVLMTNTCTAIAFLMPVVRREVGFFLPVLNEIAIDIMKGTLKFARASVVNGKLGKIIDSWSQEFFEAWTKKGGRIRPEHHFRSQQLKCKGIAGKLASVTKETTIRKIMSRAHRNFKSRLAVFVPPITQNNRPLYDDIYNRLYELERNLRQQLDDEVCQETLMDLCDPPEP